MAEFVIVGGIAAMSYFFGSSKRNQPPVETFSESNVLSPHSSTPKRHIRPRRTVTSKKKVKSTRQPAQKLMTWGDGTPRVMGRDIQPFYRGAVAPGSRGGSNVRYLSNFTGNDRMYRPPREQGALFEPVKGFTNLRADNDRQNYQHRKNALQYTMQSIHNRDTRLEDSVQVGPGLGVSIKDDATLALGRGGFHPLEQDYLRPKTVDELRARNRQKTLFEGRNATTGANRVQGRSSRPIDVQGRRLPISVGRTGIGGGGAYQKQTQKGTVIMRHTERGGAIPHVERLGATPQTRENALQPTPNSGYVQRQHLDTGSLSGAAPSAANTGMFDSSALSAPVRRIGAISYTPTNQSGMAALPSASDNRDALPAPVRRTGAISYAPNNQSGMAALPSASDNRVALPAPVRRTGAISHAPNNQSGMAALPSASDNRDAISEVGPRDLHTHAGRVPGAKNTTGGVRSYADMYNATLSELRGKEAPHYVPGTKAIVPGTHNRDATNEVVKLDRADVLQGRTAGAQYNGPRLQNAEGESARERRGVSTIGGFQLGKSQIPAATTDAITSRAEVVQEQATFVVRDTAELDVAAEQLSTNPLHVGIH